MKSKKSRLVLEVEPEFKGRLQEAATAKGMTMSKYCMSAIDKEMTKDKADDLTPRMTIEDLIARQKRVYGDRVLPGSSVDLIHEAREERDRQMESW